MKKCDFSGWATRINVECSDGRVIMKDAFKHNDGQTVPLVWNHQHNNAENVLGHALLENREEGVYAYCSFNDTEYGKIGKELVKHGDIVSLSIYANKLKQQGRNVIHGAIREVSLVLAGANPQAMIEDVMCHSDDEGYEAIVWNADPIELYHSDDSEGKGETKTMDEKKETKSESEETVADVFNTLTDKQKTVVYAMIGQALEDNSNDEGEDKEMKHNVFSDTNEVETNGGYLSHSDQEAIIALAKKPNVGTFQNALNIYMEENQLAHGFESYEELFPEYELLKKGAPEIIDYNYDWVDTVLRKVHKSPISRVRTRHVDLRASDIRAMGYTKGTEKKLIGQLSLLNRSFDPQTVYVKDKMERDDIIDITDFDVVEYQRRIMRNALNREIATAIMIGDGRQDGAEGKIKEAHIKPIWTDEELYTIHADVNIEAARAELQGTNTGANFGENYIYAEAIITAALYAREKYKGSGALDFYCTPHLLNVMLLARDLNGRRIYNSKADLAAALNVGTIYTVEKFENKTREVTEGSNVITKKLLGLFVNLGDYQVGSTRGGEITNFEDFDIDFNQYKYLMETRLSGGLVTPFSAIALEEVVGSSAVEGE